MNDFKPRLPADVRFAPTSGGVAFLTREGVVRMNGASVHLWVERLAVHLDGSRTVAELTAELPDERRAFVTSLLTTLRERGLVEDAGERGVLPVAAGATCSLLADADRFGELAPALADAMRRLGLEVLGEPSGGALVHVAAADADGLAAAGRLDRLSAERGLPVAHVLLREGEAWWSESGVVGRDVPPWAAGWRRLAAMEAVPRTAGHVSVSPVAAAVVAGQVVADLGRCLSGTPRVSGGPRLHVVDLDGFGTRTHSFLPHLSALPPGTGASAGPLGEEEFSRRAARLMDSRTGVFAEIEEGEYGQLPLHVSVTTVADPMGILGGSRARVIGVGADFAAARYRAALKAITVHGLLALDPRRLVTAEGTPLTGEGERPPDDGRLGDPLVDDVAAGRVEAFVRGRGLVEGGEVLLPARAVFLDPHATGAAAGYSADEALVTGLLDHCAALAGFGGPLPAVDVGGARAADDETARSAALLDAIGLPYQVLDATGPSGVPVYAGTLAGRLVARAAGVTPLAALRTTLEGILAAYQGIPGSAPLPELCPVVAQEPPVAVDTEAAGLGAGELAAALAGAGLRVSAVPLDHDREVHALMPHVVRVVTEPLHG
ncbi:YcaO-like family protein [Nonomuraea sp. NPDC004186]